MKKNILVLLIMVFVGGFALDLSAQDVHFSQFSRSFQRVNPALTGIFNGDMRFSAVYRNQWSAVPADYSTFNGIFDMKLMGKSESSNFGGLGLFVDYDQAGDSRLSLASLGLMGSYTIGVTDGFLITLGASAVGSQRRFDLDDLRTGVVNSQGQIEQVPFEETEDFMRTDFFFFDLSGGVNLRLQKSSRTKIDMGLGAFHLNTPNQSFDENLGEDLPLRFAITGLGSLQLTEKFDLVLNGLGQFQEPFSELVGQIMGKAYLNDNFAHELALSFGAGYRYSDNIFSNAVSDAIYPVVQVDYRNFSLGLSYDINVSDFQIATDNRGGPEISFVYIVKKVKPLSQFKNCPIY